MARNEEKRQSMLNRYLEMKAGDSGGKKAPRRPYLVSECHNLVEAEKWRLDVLREVGKRVSEIQNELLPEPKIRELNDEINRLLRLKHVWERRIVELGGQNYIGRGSKLLDEEEGNNNRVEGSNYRYFGAARNLPGVKDLFFNRQNSSSAPAKKPISRGELYKRVDVDYYGFRDDNDGDLLALEQEAEKRELVKAHEEWRQNKKQKVEAIQQHNINAYEVELEPEVFEGHELPEKSSTTSLEQDGIGQPVVPSREEMEQILLQKRKEDLLKRYVSQELQSSLQHSKTVTGRK